MPTAAHAYWTGQASGYGTATVATLPAPVVTGTSPEFSARVDLEWTAPALPIGMAITGYRVHRIVDGAPADACGTSDTAPLPANTLACRDTSLPDGSFSYAVTADVGSWTSTGTVDAPVVVAADRTPPDIRLTGVNESNALLDRRSGDYLLFFRPTATAGGSFRIDAELTDPQVGPASAAFPALTTAGWTHAGEVVTSGSGREPVVTYRSQEFAFATGAARPGDLVVTGADDRGNESSVALAFVRDTDGPGTGALVVNGQPAAAAMTSSRASGPFSVDALTNFAEAPTSTSVGLASSTLARESARYADGACESFGEAAPLAGAAPIDQSGQADACYRYTLIGTDLIGNVSTVSTVVALDASAPTGGALDVNDVEATADGSESMSTTGNWTGTRTDFVDAESGVASSQLTRSQSPLATGECSSFGPTTTIVGAPTESGRATGCYRYTLTGTNRHGLASAIQTTVRVDRIAPVGGEMTVNGAPAGASGTSSVNTTGIVTVASLTGFLDTQSGISGNEVTRTFAPVSDGTCGAFEPSTTTPVPGVAPFDVSGLADGCHRFVLTGTDRAGNSSSIATTVLVDATAPVGATLSVNGVPAIGDGTVAYTEIAGVTVDWSKHVDPQTGLTDALLQRTRSTTLTDGVCSDTFNQAKTLTSGPTPTSGTTSENLPTSARCYLYELSGTNGVGLSSSLRLVVWYDSSAPTSSGSLTVNGKKGSTSGTSSTSRTGSFSITSLATFADPESGLVSTMLTRTSAPVTGGSCGAFTAASTVSLDGDLPLAQTGLAAGCYRYQQTATNGVGGTRSLVTTVIVG